MTCDYKCTENDGGTCKLGLARIKFNNEVEEFLYKHILGAPECVMVFELQQAKK